MSFFTTIWRTQVTRLLPPELRSTSLIDWITSLVEPLQTVLSDDISYEEETRRRALYNGQKLVLQDALNVIFGQAPNDIYIETQQGLTLAVFAYNEDEGIDLFSYNESEGNPPIYLFNEDESVDAYDFIVYVPVGIYTAELDRRIRAEVNLYKIAGKTFGIETY